MPQATPTASSPARRIALVAASGRALAASARHGGIEPVVLDCFADADTRALAAACHPVCRTDRPVPDLDAVLTLHHAGRLGNADGFVPGGGVEHDIPALRRLAQALPLLGNDAAVFDTVTTPRVFFTLLDELAVPHPETHFVPPADSRGWLVKRGASCGGMGVARADRAVAGADVCYQRERTGQPMSILFLADGHTALTVGWNRLEHGWPGGTPFGFRGAAGCPAPAVAGEVELAVRSLTRRLGLRGLNGLDFLLSPEGGWIALEVNARPTATLPLHDPDWPDGLLAAHLQACAGHLPHAAPTARARSRGLRVVFALRDGTAPPLQHWPAATTDLPPTGTRVRADQPLCTVHAEGDDARTLTQQLDDLERRAQRACLPKAA